MKKLVFSFLALAASTAHAQWGGDGFYGTGAQPSFKYVPVTGATAVEAEKNCTDSVSVTTGLGKGKIVGRYTAVSASEKNNFYAVPCVRQDEKGQDVVVAGIDMTETTAKDSCRKDDANNSDLKKGTDKGVALQLHKRSGNQSTIWVLICKRPTASTPAPAPKRVELNSQEVVGVKEKVAMQIDVRGKSRFIQFDVQRNLGFWGDLQSLDIAIEDSNGNRTGCQLHDFNGNAYSKIIGLRKVLCADVKDFGYEGGTDNDFCLQVVTAQTERAALRFYSTEDESLRNPRSISPLLSANVFSSSYLSKMFSKPGACLP